MSEIIFHHYPQSPVAEKVRVAFGMKAIDWQSVIIPRLPPKPLLMPLTGGYRRTPVAQIGADIYGDSQNIFRTLDEAEPAIQLVTPQSMAMASWMESTLFNLALRVILTHAMDGAPPEFIKDRGSLYFDKGWTEEQMKADLPATTRQLQAGLSMLEGQCQAGQKFLLGNKPSQADANLHYLLWFIGGRWDGGPEFLSQFPQLMAIEDAVLQCGQGQHKEISGDEALAIAREHTPQSPTGIHCFNPQNLSVGDNVSIRQAGHTADPDIRGKLRYLDDTRISIDLSADEVGDIALHLPVLGYVISKM